MPVAADSPKSECWFNHAWTEWRKRKAQDGDAWERLMRVEEYRECQRCGEFQIRQ